MSHKIQLLIILCILFQISFFSGCTTEEIQDSDGDSISDDAENLGWSIIIYTINGTMEKTQVFSDPKKTDTDGDGISDKDEMIGLSNPSDQDTDGDGVKDDEEETYGISPIHFDSWMVSSRVKNKRVYANYSKQGNIATRYDSDFDGLNDALEYTKGSDPSDKDTDDDGYQDGIDGDPCWDLSLSLNLDTFTLYKNMDVDGGADVYFTMKIGNKTFTTEVWEVSVNQQKQLGYELTYNFPDILVFGSDLLEILVYCYDEDINYLFSDTIIRVPILIRIGNSSNGQVFSYDIFNEENTEFSTSGPDALLSYRLDILRS